MLNNYRGKQVNASYITKKCSYLQNINMAILSIYHHKINCRHNFTV